MDISGLSLIFGSPWIAFPGIFVTSALSAYHLYPILERKFKAKAFGSMDEISRLMEIMFSPIEPKKLQRILLAVNLGPAIILFLLIWPNWEIGVLLSTICFVLCSKLPLNYVKSLYEKRQKKLVSQLIEGLTIMANGIKAGLSVQQSMERVVENLPNPIAQEFQLVLSQTRLGRTLEEALIEFGERNPQPDIQMLVMSINILRETGGNLAETFETIVTVIRERHKLEQKIQAMTAQGKMQGMIVSVVPVVILGMFYFMDASYVMPLFRSFAGIIILIMVFGLILIGALVIKKIVTIKV